MPLILPAQSGVIQDWGMTLRGLVRELGYRVGELVLSQPTSDGTRTLLTDTSLNQYFPSDVAQSNIWVYGAEYVVAANASYERRARSWQASTSGLTLHTPGFPNVVTAAGVYEIHSRTNRGRKIKAINEAVGQLALSWSRDVIDETLITAVNQWRYTLPSTVNWSEITKVEIQSTVDTTQVGYPYTNAQAYNYRTYCSTDISGNETWYLQFGTMPPPSRVIRIYGQAYTAELTDDLSTLALTGRWKQEALAWIYDYAEYRLAQWESNRQPAGQADRYRIMSLDRLNSAKERLMKKAPAPRPKPIIVPGHGDADSYPPYAGSEWLGVFGNQH